MLFLRSAASNHSMWIYLFSWYVRVLVYVNCTVHSPDLLNVLDQVTSLYLYHIYIHTAARKTNEFISNNTHCTINLRCVALPVACMIRAGLRIWFNSQNPRIYTYIIMYRQYIQHNQAHRRRCALAHYSLGRIYSSASSLPHCAKNGRIECRRFRYILR